MSTGCVTCEQESQLDTSPLWQRIALDDQWRVTHSFTTTLPGWLVLVPRRHVLSIAELTDREAVVLGGWQVRVSRALHAVTGCAKTYVAQFAEAEGFGHVHFHIVPRMADLPDTMRGPRIFGMLNSAAGEIIRPAEMNELAISLSNQLRAHTRGETPT